MQSPRAWNGRKVWCGAGVVLAVAILMTLTPTPIDAATPSTTADTEWGSRPALPLTEWAPVIPSCPAVVARYTASPAVSSTPPRDMPPDLVNAFTANGAIETAEFFVDDTIGGKGSHYQYPTDDVAHMVDSAEEYLGGKRSTARLPPMDQWIVKALQKHTLAGRVAVYGSMSPWYEALAVGAGAAEVTTIEYNNLTYTHPKMVQVAPRDVDPAAGFDAALSISSFDHDGLGRYGDAVHPDGDLLAMKAAQCLLRPGGLLFLTLPVGPDVVVWNLHRRYGRVRLPLLLRGWEVVDVIGWSWARFDAAADYRRSYEPVFVLRAPDGAEADADANADAVETPTKTEL